MITAEVYSRDPLTRKEKHLVGDGIDIIGQHVGGITVVNTTLMQLCPDFLTSGYPDPDKFDYRRLDSSTHLHLFASPFRSNGLTDEGEVYGIGDFGSGLAWVDNTIPSYIYPSVIAHELAHSLGYLLENSEREIEDDLSHCRDSGCIMTPGQEQPDVSIATRVTSYLHDKFPHPLDTTLFGKLYQQKFNFCGPCVDDINATVDTHIMRIERGRLDQGMSAVDYVTEAA